MDKVRAAEGAVLFLEKVSPALENVDGSSGAIGTAVNHAITVFVEIIVSAPVESATREKWLERLFEALPPADRAFKLRFRLKTGYGRYGKSPRRGHAVRLPESAPSL